MVARGGIDQGRGFQPSALSAELLGQPKDEVLHQFRQAHSVELGVRPFEDDRIKVTFLGEHDAELLWGAHRDVHR